MNPRVKNVIANDDYTLTITFANEEIKIFDVKPYMDKGIFKELSDLNYFKKVSINLGSINWFNKQDFCPDTLYEKGILIKK